MSGFEEILGAVVAERIAMYAHRASGEDLDGAQAALVEALEADGCGANPFEESARDRLFELLVEAIMSGGRVMVLTGEDLKVASLRMLTNRLQSELEYARDHPRSARAPEPIPVPPQSLRDREAALAREPLVDAAFELERSRSRMSEGRAVAITFHESHGAEHRPSGNWKATCACGASFESPDQREVTSRMSAHQSESIEEDRNAVG